MALEAVVYPQLDPFAYNACKDFYTTTTVPAAGGAWASSYHDLAIFQQQQQQQPLDLHHHHHHKAALYNNNNSTAVMQQLGSSSIQHHHQLHANWDSSSSTSVMQLHANEYWDPYSSPEAAPPPCTVDHSPAGSSFPAAPPTQAATPPSAAASTTSNRRKRRRTRSSKNKEELENQRMTHITVERNRRKQMNEYLAVLRSLMPPSYVQRGDQASIIGGAINFVKELEQLLQSMEAHKRMAPTTTSHDQDNNNGYSSSSSSSPFAEFFTFPQFSTHRATQCNNSSSSPSSAAEPHMAAESVADIEVTMVETHANLKILSKKRPRQLLKLVAALQSLRLTILHLNVTSVEDMALYSISVKVEEGCHLNTVDEIAAAVNQMLRRIQEEAAFSS